MGSTVQASVGMGRMLWPQQGCLAEHVASAITQGVRGAEAESVDSTDEEMVYVL